MATFFQGNKQVYATPAVGGRELLRTYKGYDVLTNPFRVGQDVGYGFVYKVLDSGSSAMVAAPAFYYSNTLSISVFQWSNGFCGCLHPTSTTDGLGNTQALYEASSILAGECNFQAGYTVWEDLYVTGSTYYDQRGWYIPAEDELQEVFDSGATSTYSYGKVLSSTGVCLTSTTRGRYLNFNDGTWAATTGTEQDYRLILVRRV